MSSTITPVVWHHVTCWEVSVVAHNDKMEQALLRSDMCIMIYICNHNCITVLKMYFCVYFYFSDLFYLLYIIWFSVLYSVYMEWRFLSACYSTGE